MDRLRVRIKDKRVCALVRAFLKSGVLTDSATGKTPSLVARRRNSIPVAANIALSALDDHFDQLWQQQMSNKLSAAQAQAKRHG